MSQARVVVGLALLCAGASASAEERKPMEFHMAIQADVARDPELEKLPPVRIEPILARVPVDDRLDADDAFDRPFVEALLPGLTWYLRERGLRVADADPALRLIAVLDDYEGDRGWGDWGIRLNLSLKVMQGAEALVREAVQVRLKYADDTDVEEEVRPRYRDRGAAPEFVTILFTRVGIDLGEKIIALLRDSPVIRAMRDAAGSDPAPGPAGQRSGRGLLSVDASRPHSEVLLDGRLIGTTPIDGLPLPAGTHTITVRRKGCRDWTREVLILDGAASRLMAELEVDEPGS